MRIDLLVSDGSPIGITAKTLWGDSFRVGLGGAELGLITLCEEWAKVGHTVRLYNNPAYINPDQDFTQHPIALFNPQENRDILIVFRSPNDVVRGAKGLKVWLSCDQYTIGDFRQFKTAVDKIVCISPFHQKYFRDVYGITDTISIDLPVRVADYDKKVERVPQRLLFSSVPDRGLQLMPPIWKKIKERFPQAELIITSDYRLWGVGANNEQHRQAFAYKSGVQFLGAVPRAELIDWQLSSDLMVYPCLYEELFCIAVAEACVAGAYPITTDTGAVKTTNLGLVLPDLQNNAELIEKAFVAFISARLDLTSELDAARHVMIRRARARFSPERILKEWDKEVFGCTDETYYHGHWQTQF